MCYLHTTVFNETLMKSLKLPWHSTNIKWDENHFFLRQGKKDTISNIYLKTYLQIN